MSIVRVGHPIVDLRSEPQVANAPSIDDGWQQTQLLHGEQVHVQETRDGWAFVHAVEQPYWGNCGWQGYPGWIPQHALSEYEHASDGVILKEYSTPVFADSAFKQPLTHLSMGSRIWRTPDGQVQLANGQKGWMKPLKPQREEHSIRQTLLQRAELFLGSPYFWGGYSAHAPQLWGVRSGVDCSGLGSLIYRTVDKAIPRDARDQAKMAKTVDLIDLRPGDLVFTASKEEPRTIDHVMLFVSPTLLLESTRQSSTCRFVSWKQKLGVAYVSLCQGAEPPQTVVKAASFL